MKRLFDFLMAVLMLIVLSPILVLVSLLIVLTSRGGVFFIQERAGKNFKNFGIIKFRTMQQDSHKHGLITVGMKDSRITSIGYFLRKYKIDEFPQLINIVKGDMSFVGPRPEVTKYVLYGNPDQEKVMTVRPGITSPASIEFSDENHIILKYPDHEKAYVEILIPEKLRLNVLYIENQSFFGDIKIIFRTLGKIILRK
ncbi:MAG TPA: glycosyl transferase [Bacteroidetes bacterium]|nr:glycosyl transferase [Bacteroidota bacterium]